VTGLVYGLLLRGEELGALRDWVNTVVHVVFPIVVVLDWLLVPPVRRLALRRTLWWLAFPLVYLAYSLIRGAAVHWYPYPFLSPDQPGGYWRVAGYGVAIAVVMAVVVVVVTGVGNRSVGRPPLRRRR
jgi:hypothetical protein